MASPAEQIQFQTSALRGLIGGVQAGQWDDPTPCAQWTVRDLTNHLLVGGTMFAASFRGETPEIDFAAPPDLVGDDPTGAWDRLVGEFEAAVSAPGAMDRDVVLPFATLPAQVALDIAAFDLLLHAWDLARATGQSFEPPDDVVARSQAIAEGMLDAMRDGDIFSSATTAPAGASPIDRLAAFSGRTV